MKKLCLIFVAAVLVAGACFSVQAYSGDLLMAANGSAPTIDGNIGSAEWADAACYYLTSYPYVATAYIKQDSSNLYIAVDQEDNTPYGGDSIRLCFDVEHTDESSLQSDDIAFQIYRDGTVYEYYAQPFLNSWYTTSPSGWSVAFTSSSEHFQAEFSISLSKLGVTAGVPETLGILFYFSNEYSTNGGTNAAWYSWPWGTGGYTPHIPSDWAEIIVGDPDFVIPEFWLGTVLGLTGCLAAFGIYYMSKRRRISL